MMLGSVELPDSGTDGLLTVRGDVGDNDYAAMRPFFKKLPVHHAAIMTVVVAAVIICIVGLLILVLRVSGKRQVGQLSPFDLVLLLVLSNAVQNAINGGDNSVLGGIISAVTLVGLNYIVGLATYKSKKLEAMIEGRPEVLIHNGVLFTQVMDHQKLTHHELNSALRSAGCGCIEEVHFAILENDGQITVQPRTKASPGNIGER